MLVNLLYASRVAPGVSGEITEAILQQSREKNPRLGITGILCQGGDVHYVLCLPKGGKAADLHIPFFKPPRAPGC